jgi:hypothetical protein
MHRCPHNPLVLAERAMDINLSKYSFPELYFYFSTVNQELFKSLSDEPHEWREILGKNSQCTAVLTFMYQMLKGIVQRILPGVKTRLKLSLLLTGGPSSFFYYIYLLNFKGTPFRKKH